MPWLKFRLIERPYWDKDGNVLVSIKGMRNRKGVDEIHGGGKVYPEIPFKVLERYEQDGFWYVLVDATQADIDAFIAKDEANSYQASPKEQRVYRTTYFEAALFSPPVESGVTKQGMVK